MINIFPLKQYPALNNLYIDTDNIVNNQVIGRIELFQRTVYNLMCFE